MQNKPVYHFSPSRNWMNDPNGTVFRDGEYHLFYQYNPEGSGWGNIQWAYATSKDLVDWERKGLRLTPEADKGERYCFSGCAVPEGDGYVLSYTSIGFEDWAVQQHARQRFCRADKNFNRIERLYDKDMTEKDNPFEVREWRDPFVFSYNGVSYLLLCGVRWNGGKSENSILLYESKNGSLTDWQFVDVLFTDPDHILECPNMAMFGGSKVALVYSTITDRKVKYIAGDFDGKRIWERSRGVVDWSLKSFYATNLSGSADGGTVLYGWMGENLLQGDSPDGTYSGCLALPRSIEMDEQYKLRFAPVQALSKLESGSLTYQNNEIAWDGVQARLTFDFIGEGRFTLTEDGREKMTVRVYNDEAAVSRVSCYSLADECEQRMKLESGARHRFDIFIDGSAAEIFADGTQVLSLRMYRSEKPSKLFSLKEGKVENMRAVKMRAAAIKGE